MATKKNRKGEIKKNKQGLTMQIIEYVNNKNITIKFLESGEKRKTSYLRFRRGTVSANFHDYPPHTDCTFGQAKFFIITTGVLILAALCALAHCLLK